MSKSGKGILVVSFGTSYEETRKKTIDQIEASMRQEYPTWRVYRAWTSGMIRRKIKMRDGIDIPDVEEALIQMAADGMADVVVQPTHVINGIENDQMLESVRKCGHLFSRISVGKPLLTTQEDNVRIVRVIAQELRIAEDEALVLMGHGTEHYANSIYAALDYQFKDMGYSNIFMGTVEAYPALDSLMRRVQEQQFREVVLAPFMIVAGDHAENDLAGSDADSWKSRFESAGFEVRCVLKGLGEYAGVREMFLDHVRDAMDAAEMPVLRFAYIVRNDVSCLTG
ncbi:MAG: sirohydrochlorin cobaltochelatase [Clostridiales bacterium]|nr:sirohydrochlorin cobaltochelatase [Clostridiales bacterium]